MLQLLYRCRSWRTVPRIRGVRSRIVRATPSTSGKLELLPLGRRQSQVLSSVVVEVGETELTSDCQRLLPESLQRGLKAWLVASLEGLACLADRAEFGCRIVVLAGFRHECSSQLGEIDRELVPIDPVPLDRLSNDSVTSRNRARAHRTDLPAIVVGVVDRVVNNMRSCRRVCDVSDLNLVPRGDYLKFWMKPRVENFETLDDLIQ